MTVTVRYFGKVIGANRRLAVGRGRIYSESAYQGFVKSLALIAMSQAGRKKFKPEQRLAVLIEATIHPRMDVDNLIKPCLDAMQHAGIVPNDNQFDDVQARRVGVVKSIEASLAITVREA